MGVDRRAETVTFRATSRRGGGEEEEEDEDEDEDVVVTVRQNRGAIAVDPTARWVWDSCPLVCEYLCDEENVDGLVRGRRVVLSPVRRRSLRRRGTRTRAGTSPTPTEPWDRPRSPLGFVAP